MARITTARSEDASTRQSNYQVVVFRGGKGKGRLSTKAVSARDEAQAISMVGRLLQDPMVNGAVATVQEIDADAGYYGEVKVLEQGGIIPDGFSMGN